MLSCRTWAESPISVGQSPQSSLSVRTRGPWALQEHARQRDAGGTTWLDCTRIDDVRFNTPKTCCPSAPPHAPSDRRATLRWRLRPLMGARVGTRDPPAHHGAGARMVPMAQRLRKRSELTAGRKTPVHSSRRWFDGPRGNTPAVLEPAATREPRGSESGKQGVEFSGDDDRPRVRAHGPRTARDGVGEVHPSVRIDRGDAPWPHRGRSFEVRPS